MEVIKTSEDRLHNYINDEDVRLFDHHGILKLPERRKPFVLVEKVIVEKPSKVRDSVKVHIFEERHRVKHTSSVF